MCFSNVFLWFLWVLSTLLRFRSRQQNPNTFASQFYRWFIWRFRAIFSFKCFRAIKNSFTDFKWEIFDQGEFERENFINQYFNIGYAKEANLYQVFRHIVKSDGLKGLTCGLHATVWRDTFTYGKLKKYFSRNMHFSF